MKHFSKLIIVLFAVLLAFSCQGSPSSSPASASFAASAGQSAGPPPYTGDGGKGLSLAVLVPDAKGIGADQNYLPTMVQGVLVGDMARYSAIRVLDRMTLEKTLKETESGIYKNEADYGQLGEIANVDYALTGSISKTGSGYAMQIQVVGTGKSNIGVTKASYSGSCTIAELDNFVGIRKASMDLLSQMGVSLTDSAKRELSGAGRENYVNAQTALAQGIVAQRSGNTIETMARFYQANEYDPSFTEAAARANSMSSSIRTGSLGENIRNDIRWRDEWLKILVDAGNYLRAHPPVVANLIYDPNLKHTGTDYDKRTADFEFSMELKGVTYPQSYRRMESDLNAGLAATKRNGDWKLNEISLGRIWSWDIGSEPGIVYTAELVNSNGKKIAETTNRNERRQYSVEIGFSFEPTETKALELKRRRYPISVGLRAWADDITDQMTISLSARVISWDDPNKVFDNYTVQVMTTAEYQPYLARTRNQLQSQIGETGLAPMPRTEIMIYHPIAVRPGSIQALAYQIDSSLYEKARNLISIEVEVASNLEEASLGLSYRQSLSDGEGLYIDGRNLVSEEDRRYGRTSLDEVIEAIDTSNYRFPVSVAFIVRKTHSNRDNYGTTYDAPTISEIKTINPGRKERIPKNCWAALIVPKDWFQRNGIKKGDIVDGGGLISLR